MPRWAGYAAMPEGEDREALLQRSTELRTEAEEMAAATRLEPTTVRAGKQARRRDQRSMDGYRSAPARQCRCQRRCAVTS